MFILTKSGVLYTRFNSDAERHLKLKNNGEKNNLKWRGKLMSHVNTKLPVIRFCGLTAQELARLELVHFKTYSYLYSPLFSNSFFYLYIFLFPFWQNLACWFVFSQEVLFLPLFFSQEYFFFWVAKVVTRNKCSLHEEYCNSFKL